MRRFDKKLNINKVNLLSEQRYLNSKDMVNENTSELEEDWKTNLAAGLASLGGGISANAQQTAPNQTAATTQQAPTPKPVTKAVNPFNVGSSTKSKSLLTVNFTKSFESGKFRLKSNYQKESIDKIKNYITSNPDNNYVIYITASESKVPNQEGFGEGQLAQKRADVLKDLILSNTQMDNVEVKVDAVVGGPEWADDNKNDPKYTEHQ